MIFYNKSLEGGVGLSLEPNRLLRNCCCILKPAIDLCFKGCKAILLTPLGRLEPRHWILRDYDNTVSIDCFMAIVVAAFAIHLVITMLDVTPADADPWDADRTTFLEDWDETFLGVISSSRECRVHLLEKEMKGKEGPTEHAKNL